MYLIKLLLLVFLACPIYGHTSNDECKIHGKIIGNLPEKLEYSIPIDGNCYWGFTEKVEFDNEGEFEVSFVIQQPVFIRFIGYGHINCVILEAGESYEADLYIN